MYEFLFVNLHAHNIRTLYDLVRKKLVKKLGRGELAAADEIYLNLRREIFVPSRFVYQKRQKNRAYEIIVPGGTIAPLLSFS